MEESLKYKKGDVVVFNFPFSDSNKSKKEACFGCCKYL